MEDMKTKDELLLKILELSANYQGFKAEEQRLLSAAHLHLASARVVLGHQRLSRDSFDYRMQSQVSLDALDEWFLASGEDLSVDKKSVAKDPSSSLRQRRSVLKSTVDSGSDTTFSTTEDTSNDKPPVVDPLRWFGGLAPQALRSAQKDFQQGVYYVPEGVALMRIWE